MALSVPKRFSLTPGGGGPITNVFDEVGPVASSTTTTVVEYTVPTGKTFFLALVEFSGENIATYEVYIDGVRKRKKNTYFGGPLFGDFWFRELEVSAGKKIELRVVHDRPESGLFSGTIMGVEQ